MKGVEKSVKNINIIVLLLQITNLSLQSIFNLTITYSRFSSVSNSDITDCQIGSLKWVSILLKNYNNVF